MMMSRHLVVFWMTAFLFTAVVTLPGCNKAGGDADLPPPTMPLYEAVVINDLEQIRANIAHGADLNELHFDETGGRFAALHAASRSGYIEAVRLLIEAGADVNVRADAPHRATPLHWAARANHVEVVRLLVEHGADIHALAGVDNDRTPLLTAEERGYFEVVQLLRDLGATH